MQTVGIRDLKNKLTHYLKLTKGGDRIIVTDRGSPIAVIHGLDHVEDEAGTEERLAVLSKRGMVRLPLRKGKLSPFEGIDAPGKPASKIITEERR